MAEPQTQQPDAPRPRPGGNDQLTQLLDAGLQPLDAPLPGPVVDRHPNEMPFDDEGALLPPQTTPSPDAGQPLTAPQFRYESQQAAEQAEQEAQRRITEETQRRSALERELELYRQHNALLERQVQQGPQSPTPPSPGQDGPQTPAPPFNVKEHLRGAYQRMQAVNPAAEDFEAQQQTIFIDALSDAVDQLRTTTSLTEAQITARVDAGIQAALPAVQQGIRQQSERDRLLGKLNAYGAEHGLDMTEGGEQYQDVMYAVERSLYPQAATEDEAIAYVVDRVAQLRGVATTTPPVQPGSPPSSDGARPATHPPTTPQRAQALNTPMERSGMGRQADAPDEMDTRSFSLSEMLDRSLRVRRP